MHLGFDRRISATAAFSELIVLLVRIVPAAAASLRNSLDFACKAIFKMGSNKKRSDFERFLIRVYFSLRLFRKL